MITCALLNNFEHRVTGLTQDLQLLDIVGQDIAAEVDFTAARLGCPVMPPRLTSGAPQRAWQLDG